MRLFSAREIFSTDAFDTKNGRRKLASRKWSRFMLPVSGACVMNISEIMSECKCQCNSVSLFSQFIVLMP